MKTLAGLPLAARAVRGAEFRSRLDPGITRPWIGPEYWANPLQDWRLHDERIECIQAGGDRNICLLTRELGPLALEFSASVRLGRLGDAGGEGWAGFRVGIRGYFGDYRDSALRGLGLNAGVTADGRLFIGELAEGSPRIVTVEDLELRLEGRPALGFFELTLAAFGANGQKHAEVKRPGVTADSLIGGLALVCNSGPVGRSPLPVTAPVEGNGGNKPGTQRGGNVRFWFRDWVVEGRKVVAREQRAWGPVLFTMYTLSRGVLKMTAQIAPVERFPEAQLQVRRGSSWDTVARTSVDPDSCTARFRVDNWRERSDVPYRVTLGEAGYTGVIRHDPVEKNRIVAGSLTCQNDFGFPHTPIARNLTHLKPDILFFTGDQLYERSGEYGTQREPAWAARLDYLRKWFLFGWSWGNLTREIPTVCLPDDHDVYHGNVWGAAGKKAQGVGQVGQDSGGFTMPADWVNLVQRTQSSHLPDPPDSSLVDQGIAVHYSHLVLGGVSFALLEDRKWKSPPKDFLPKARIINGWPQNPEFTAAQADISGAQLLGERQEKFLEQWAADWSGGIWMKAAVSATIFCNLATLPQSATSDSVVSKLEIPPEGEIVKGDKTVMDHDSNGWPQTPRNRALRLLRKAQAVHLAGDQHLPSTLQYGVDTWNDASWVICSPAISNIFPRRWFPPVEGKNRKPGAPPYLGEHIDGFGNKITVHAVASPHKTGIEPESLHQRIPGFGVVEFVKDSRKITFTNWPRWVDVSKPAARPLDGWPITIRQMDNGLATAAWVLEEVESDVADVIAQVWKESREEGSDSLVWCCRIAGKRFVPRVWSEGVYRVKLVKEGYEKIVRGIVARLEERVSS